MSYFTKLKTETKNLHWTEKAGLLGLALMLVPIPVNSGVSMFFMVLWIATIVLKNSLLKRWSFFGWHQDKNFHGSTDSLLMVAPMACYWLVYLLSMLWTENKVEGWDDIARLMLFMIIPLVFACTDFREVKKIHLRSILWLYVLLMPVLYVVFTGVDYYKTCWGTDKSLSWYLSEGIFNYLHHSYVAVFLLTGLVFLYTELDGMFAKEKQESSLLLIGIYTCLLLSFLFIVNSRAGTVCLLLLLLLCWLHQAFVRKRTRLALILLVLLPVLVTTVYFAQPKEYRRITTSIEQSLTGERTDARIILFERSWSVFKDHMILGVGTGDRMDELDPLYKDKYGVPYGTLNSHNQYMDTSLSTGIIGLTVLLLMLFVPMRYARKNKNFFFFSTILLFAVAIIFESMLERQMGVVYWTVLLILAGTSKKVAPNPQPS